MDSFHNGGGCGRAVEHAAMTRAKWASMADANARHDNTTRTGISQAETTSSVQSLMSTLNLPVVWCVAQSTSLNISERNNKQTIEGGGAAGSSGAGVGDGDGGRGPTGSPARLVFLFSTGAVMSAASAAASAAASVCFTLHGNGFSASCGVGDLRQVPGTSQEPFVGVHSCIVARD
ncbi:hypothetical protein E4U54_004011 [Claviceps lovelessii]|nr:hypothetical protein E4U54_004011 [Claviceps lovelessii]